MITEMHGMYNGEYYVMDLGIGNKRLEDAIITQGLHHFASIPKAIFDSLVSDGSLASHCNDNLPRS